MPDEAAAPAANPIATPAAPASTGSTSDIASLLAERRKAPPTPATPVTAGAAEEESPAPTGEDDAAAVSEQPPGETEEIDPAGEPPIDAPKSWTKAEKEAFQTLPRDHQQAIADREREREAHYRKGHDEAAAKAREASEAKTAAEQVRQQYEQALPQLYAQYQSQFAAEFQDLKSLDDVEKMQAEDPMRFMRWQFQREKGLSLERQANEAQARKQQESQENWQKFGTAEDKKFLEKAPEFADPKRQTAAIAEAKAYLAELGFSEAELNDAYSKDQRISFRDHRIQLALRDAAKYRAAQAKLKAATPKPVPPVQRPGTPTNGRDTTAHIQNLTSKLKSTGSVRDAAALISAKRGQQARAS